MENNKDLNYYRTNAEENYLTTPISVLRYITELEQALQLQQGGVSGSVFYKVMSGNSELEKFKTEEKALEICNWYRVHGFPYARVVKTDR